VRLTDEDVASIEDCLDAAAAWRRGELPWQAAANVGAVRTGRGEALPSYTRHIAVRITPKSDTRRADLLALIDVLVRAEGYVVTTNGVFRPEEIRANEAGWQYANLRGRS
jgi:glutathione synthase/RimK-type ligase-like ATP-grasp enzyme